MMKIGFCFLTRKRITHIARWEDFFKRAPLKKYQIFTHPSDREAFVKNHAKNLLIKGSVIKDLVPTSWGSASLVIATSNLFKEAVENKCDYMFLLSESCLPIRSFNFILKTVSQSGLKSRIPVTASANFPLARKEETIYSYKNRLINWQTWDFESSPLPFPKPAFRKVELLKGWQWIGMSSKDFARMGALHLKPFTRYLQNDIKLAPDEWYFQSIFHYKDLLENCITHLPPTYVYWNGSGPHPSRYPIDNIPSSFLREARSKESFFVRKIY